VAARARAPDGAPPGDRASFDAAQVARAVRWTACLHNGRGDRRTISAPSLDEARRIAVEELLPLSVGGRRPMIYAVTPEGWSIHVENA
jgi:hypothetical protein